MDTLLKKKFHVPRSHSFWENCDGILKLSSHFSPILCDLGTWNLFCILTHMDTLSKRNFMFFGLTVFEKNAMMTCKIQSCKIVLINNFEILQVSIVFFSNTVRPRNLKFILYINLYGYSFEKKISCSSVAQFLRKLRWYLEIIITFFSDTVRPRNLKFILYINPYGYSLQKKISFSSVAQFLRKMRWQLANLKLHNCPNKQLWNFTS